ncbi:spindle pole body interacting protein [Apiospora arundinis]
MEGRLRQCTICGAFSAKPCSHCCSTAYCSPECEQTDWPIHKTPCSYFQNFRACRPSGSHYLGIWFPMTGDRQRPPELCWLQAEEVEKGIFEPAQTQVDLMLRVPGRPAGCSPDNSAVHVVRSNILRGRPRLPDSLHIMYLDQDKNDDGLLKVNETLPQNLASAKKKEEEEGGIQWKGPLLVYLKAGTDFDAPNMADVTLTDYRDAIDYLSYYRPALSGSLIDLVGGLTAHPDASSYGDDEYIMTRLTQKVQGVRINCVGDQLADPDGRRFVAVDVPKTHPLFETSSSDAEDEEGCSSDMLDVAHTSLGEGWVAYTYKYKHKIPRGRGGGRHRNILPYPFNDRNNHERSLADAREEEANQRNPCAEKLMRRISGDLRDLRRFPGSEEDDQSLRWAAIPKWRLPLTTGSILVVKRDQTDLKISTVRALCQLLEYRVMPLLAREQEVGKRAILDALKDKEALKGFM